MNPDHDNHQLAAAIEWEDKTTIPFISALGQGLVADEILDTALHHKVPILENPLLMMELMKLEKNQNIPEHLYLSVAQVLAFVYHLSGQAQH